MTTLQTIQDAVLEAVDTAEDFVVETVESLVENLTPLVADTPRVAAIDPSVLTGAIDDAFALAEKLLASNHAFVTSLVDAVAPLTSAPATATAPVAEAS